MTLSRRTIGKQLVQVICLLERHPPVQHGTARVPVNRHREVLEKLLDKFIPEQMTLEKDEVA